MLAKGTRIETGNRHFGLGRSDPEFHRDNQLLSAAWHRRRLGAGAASPFFTTMRPWLLGLSVALLGLGFWQQHRAKQCSIRGRVAGNVLLWAAVAIVLGMVLFPQEIAAFIADRLDGAWKQ
jgi:hypothetical protein